MTEGRQRESWRLPAGVGQAPQGRWPSLQTGSVCVPEKLLGLEEEREADSWADRHLCMPVVLGWRREGVLGLGGEQGTRQICGGNPIWETEASGLFSTTFWVPAAQREQQSLCLTCLRSQS